MLRYFAYGSNMSSLRLVRRVGDVVVVGAAILRSYRHAFTKRGADGTAKGNVEPHPDEHVWGVVYQISSVQLRKLDVVEGGYRRIAVTVERDSGALEAVTYAAIAPRVGLMPARDYLEHYERGIREHGIPDHYWARLRRALGFSK